MTALMFALLPRAVGVSRDAQSPGGRGVEVFFERELSDDELRSLHDILAGRSAPPTDEQIDVICAPGRAKRWTGDGRQYDRETVRLVWERLCEVPGVRPLFARFGIVLDEVSTLLTELAEGARERGQDSTAAGREAQAFALTDLLHHLIACHHVPSANGQPLFWYRPRSDGGHEGPLHDSAIEEVRKRSGAWVPLYAGQAPTEPRPKAWPELLPLLNDYAGAMTDAALHQSASKVDIAKSQAMKALQRLRAAIYGDAKRYGEVPR